MAGNQQFRSLLTWLRTSGWRWVIGLGLVVLLVRLADPVQLFNTLSGISLRWAFVTVLVAGLWLFLGGFNVWLLLRSLTPITLRTFLPAYIMSWATSHVVPGQLGDATQVLLLRRHGVPIEASSAAYLVDKFVSLVWMLMVTAFGFALYAASLRGWWLLALPVGGGVLGLAALIILRGVQSRPEGYLARFQGLVERLVVQLRSFRRYPRRIVLNVVLTVFKWVVVGFKYWCAFYTLGAAIPYSATATIPVMSSLVGYIPVTVGGIGTTELTAIALFERAGASVDIVLSVYLFLRGVLFLIALIFLVLLRSEPPKRRE